MLALDRPNLLRNTPFVAGNFEAEATEAVAVIDPASRDVVARVTRTSDAAIARALDGADAVLPALRAMVPRQRAAIVRALADAIRAAREDLAKILTAEQGKPLAEARSEIDYGLTYLDHYGEAASALEGQLLAAPSASDRLLVQPEPIGIGVAITPWNFPFAMVARKLAPAFVAGNAVLLKPAEQTPLTSLAFAAIAAEVGLPEGSLSVLPGDRADAARIGERLLADGRVRKLSFTGSTAVGKHLYALSAPTVKRLSLELGGNAAFLVFEDADLDAAVDGVMMAKFRNAGQACVAANRILVAKSVHAAFVERLEARIRALRVGPGTETGVTVGPLIDERASTKVGRHLADALAKGARGVVLGGASDRGGSFFEPALIVDVPHDALLNAEETFGPLAAIATFEREDEAVRRANATPYGLASYVYARDVGRVHRVSSALETGMVAVNAGTLSSALAPFGGIKESGLGKEGGRLGLEEWTNQKYVRIGGLDR